MGKALIALVCAGCLSLPITYARADSLEQLEREMRYEELKYRQHELEEKMQDIERERDERKTSRMIDEMFHSNQTDEEDDYY